MDAADERSVDRKIAACLVRARIALALIAVVCAWTAYDSYSINVRPWRDGTLLAHEAVGELKRLIDLEYYMVMVTGIASVATLVLAVIAGNRTRFAINAALAIFAAYTALRLYQTDGGYLSVPLWWVSAILLATAFRAGSTAIRLRRSHELVEARLVA